MNAANRKLLAKNFERLLCQRYPAFELYSGGISPSFGKLFRCKVAEKYLFVLLQFSKNSEKFTLEVAITSSNEYPFSEMCQNKTTLELLLRLPISSQPTIRLRTGLFISQSGDTWWPAAEEPPFDWGLDFLQPKNEPKFESLIDSITSALQSLSTTLERLGLSENFFRDGN